MKNMKKLILIAGILINIVAFGAETEPLKTEFSKKLVFNLSEVELDASNRDFVIVSFYVRDQKIEITETNGTQEQLIEKVKNKLSLLMLEEGYDEDKLYQYKITFKKYN